MRLALGAPMAKPFQRILVPIDLSPCSAAALQLAAQLAEVHAATLQVLHARSDASEAVAAEQAEVEQFVASVLGDGAPLPVVHVTSGSPRDVILTFVERLKCDVIVLGTNGRTGRTRMLAGSVAESVVRAAACPVVTVRSPRLMQ